jgi:hypothetical protein
VSSENSRVTILSLPLEVLQLIFYMTLFYEPSLSAKNDIDLWRGTRPVYEQILFLASVCKKFKEELENFFNHGFHPARTDPRIRIPSWLAALSKIDQRSIEKPPVVKAVFFRPLLSPNMLNEVCQIANLPAPNEQTRTEFARILYAAKNPVILLRSARKIFYLLTEYAKTRCPYFHASNEIPKVLHILERLLNNTPFSELFSKNTLKVSDMVNLKASFGHAIAEQCILAFLRNYDLIKLYQDIKVCPVNLISIVVAYRENLRNESLYGRTEIQTKIELLFKTIQASSFLKIHPELLGCIIELASKTQGNNALQVTVDKITQLNQISNRAPLLELQQHIMLNASRLLPNLPALSLFKVLE